MSAESSLGTYLRECRERSGLSVDAISSASRIVPALVRALEGEQFDLLPAPVYVRGFIRAYCAQVGVDPEEALGLYEAHEASARVPALRPPPPNLAPRPPARRWGPAAAGAALLVALGMAVTFLVVRGQQPDAAASRGSTPRVTRSPAPAAPSVPAARVPPTTGAPGEISPPSSAPAVPPGSLVARGTAVATTAPEPRSGERVLLVRAVDATWVRVAPEGAPASEVTLQPGAVREWRSAGSFRVSVGNAGGVEIELDGQALPALGQWGEVIHTTIPGEARP